MELRPLGKSGIRIAPLMLGGNVFGWNVDEAASFRILDAFLDAGFNAIDTADVYSRWAPGNKGGESEAIIGKWMKSRGNRDKVVVATKVGMDMGPGGTGLSKAHILASVEGSLARLQTDHIDLYQSHKDDPAVPVEEPLGVYAQLIEAGKVRAIGASNFEAPRLRAALDASKAHGLPRYETLQPEYNLYDRSGFEGGLQQICLEEGLGAITYFSLAKGFLSGKYRSKADLGKSAARGGGVGRYLDQRGMRMLAVLDEVAERLAATPARIALAWLMAQPGVAAPIASATSPEQLRDILAAAEIELDRDALARLDGTKA